MSVTVKKLPLKFSYDEERDIIEIEGKKYMGDLFRKFGLGETPLGECFRIVKSSPEGAITFEVIRNHENA